MAEAGTEIRIGWTDGNRFIGIKPPLNDAEIVFLKAKGALRGGIEQVSLEQPCTLVRTGGDFTTPEAHTEETIERAERLAASLRSIRPNSEEVVVSPEVVVMSGYQSSPFNPSTR